MLQGRWIIKKNVLGLEVVNSGNFIVPTAREVYQAQFKNVAIVRGANVSRPSDEVQIKFSKIPLDVQLILEPVSVDGTIEMHTRILANLRSVLIKITSTPTTDHLIYSNHWYPLAEDIEAILVLIRNANIDKLGKITLKQYADLKKLNHPLIQDRNAEFPLDKDKLISQAVIEIPLFDGSLYPYQYQGYRFLKMIAEESAGCVLADEMGLGKTAQIIALLSSTIASSSTPNLVIAPVSLLENWRRELLKFAPTIVSIVHQGSDRTGYFRELSQYQVVITSYDTVIRDLSLFSMIQWNIVVADEAQAIKNSDTKRSSALKAVPRRVSIAVTGTPVENSLSDLWSIADFAFPNYLGDLRSFRSAFPDDVEGAQKLEPIISPILLRRRVRDVANDLPSRIDIPQVLALNAHEAQQYETLRQEIIDQYGQNATLVSLIKLRMFCTHPWLVYGKKSDPSSFVKYARLVEIIEEVTALKEKAIIFTSYNDMADLLMNDLSKRFGLWCDYIDGRVDVADRHGKIDEFTAESGSAILILNPRAAGAGLNITAANHVIHYNLEWNPAIEDQASARSYRRGQTRPVSIYRLYIADTVEEIINERLEQKRGVSDTAVIGTDGKIDDVSLIIQALLRSPLNK